MGQLIFCTDAKHRDGQGKGLMIHARAQTSTGVKHRLHTTVYTRIKKHLGIQKAVVPLSQNPVSSLALGKENLSLIEQLKWASSYIT